MKDDVTRLERHRPTEAAPRISAPGQGSHRASHVIRC